MKYLIVLLCILSVWFALTVEALVRTALEPHAAWPNVYRYTPPECAFDEALHFDGGHITNAGSCL